MTVATKQDVFKALLALDSYNEGYDSGLLHGVVKIGNATLLGPADGIPPGKLDEWKSAGFYAAAYRLDDGTTVISYRGTDNTSIFDTTSGDLYTGWVAATGTNTAQVKLALDFYKAVTGKTVYEGVAANTALTGHSLGGGLAGLASALSGTPAVTFDHMPFGIISARLAADNPMPDGSKRELKFNQINGFFTEGELLQQVRSGLLISAIGSLPSSVLYPLGLWLGVDVDPIVTSVQVQVIAAKIAAYESAVDKMSMDSHWDKGLIGNILNIVNLHSQALLTNLMYAEYAGHTEWFTIANQLWSAVFSNNIGLNVGFGDTNNGGKYNAASKMLSYYGDTAFN